MVQLHDNDVAGNNWLADVARHVIGCYLTQETRDQNALGALDAVYALQYAPGVVDTFDAVNALQYSPGHACATISASRAASCGRAFRSLCGTPSTRSPLRDLHPEAYSRPLLGIT